MHNTTFLQRAGEWFLHSGIQGPEGGVARYYRADLGRNLRTSTEITGYTVSALCYLYKQTEDSRYLDAATKAGSFLCLEAWDAGAGIFPFEWPPTEAPEENRAFFFDCGIIIRGLLTLYRLRPDPLYLEVATACGHGMARAFAHHGNIAPILQLPGGAALAYGNTWSNNPGCYQLKSALAWKELYEMTGDARFNEHFEHALALALANYPEFLPGASERQRVMDRLHAFSYFNEALLSVAERPECARALGDGIRRTAFHLRDVAPEFARSDVYGQLLRVRLFADALGAVELDKVQAAEEAAAMPVFQLQSTDVRLDGGFTFGKRNGAFAPHANPVSTAFCLQALAMWEAYQGGGIRDTWRDLI